MRKIYIDNTRWITVVLVVIYHVIYMFNHVTIHGILGPLSDRQPQDIYQYIVYPWFMILLFVISGMSSRFYLEHHTDKEFIKSRTRKLLVPSTIGVLVGGWILGYYNMIIADAFKNIGEVPGPILFLIMCLSGTGVLWYIQMLWVFSMLLLIIRKIEKDRLYKFCERTNCFDLILLTIIIYFSAQILNTPIIIVYRFGIYFIGFLIGYFILSHDKVMERLEQSRKFFGLFAIISCFLFIFKYYGKNYADHEVLDTILCNVYAWFGTLGVLSFMKHWGNFENSFSKWMIRKSWGLYIFHYLFTAMSSWYLHIYTPNLIPIAVYLIVGLASFLGAFLLYEIISRIPLIRWCILGMRKEDYK